MAQKLNPFSSRQFLDANGDPYSGAQLFVYTAGSSTKTTVTKDSAGSSAHANPIILNSKGEPGDGAGAAQAIWQTEGEAVKLVLAPSTDTDPPVAAISTWDNLSGINDTTVTIDQWISGPTPTYVSTTSFTLVGDQTSDFHVGRRLKTTNTAGTVYSTIVTTAYTTLTTVTVVNDSGALDSGLSAVSYGIITYTNRSLPSVWKQGADVASAAALPVLPDGNYFDVTGTTTITSIDTLGVNSLIKLHFDDALTLTHHATNLILPGGANITTAAGDEFEFFEYGSGTWRCTKYQKAAGAYSIVQIATSADGAAATGTTTIPQDNTIPQITEGDEYMSVTITPTNSANKLIIEAKAMLDHSASTSFGILALFQDSTADALATGIAPRDSSANRPSFGTIYYEMTAGTTSSTTFRIRAGFDAAGTTRFNSTSSGAIFNGTLDSYIKVTEVLQ